MSYYGRKPTPEQLLRLRPRYFIRESFIRRNRVFEVWNGLHQFFLGQKIVRRARRILAEKLGRPLLTSECAHHENDNTLDDRRSNITLMKAGEHSRHHKIGKKRLDLRGKKLSPETRAKISLSQKKARAEGRHIGWPKGQALSLKHRQKLSKKMTSPEIRAKISRAIKQARDEGRGRWT